MGSIIAGYAFCGKSVRVAGEDVREYLFVERPLAAVDTAAGLGLEQKLTPRFHEPER